MLSLVVSLNWKIHQIDVNNAFLNGDFQEKVYMTQPHGFEDKTYHSFVFQLRKGLYGLKHAPRAWYEKLKKALFDRGFTDFIVDSNLFIFKKENVATYILIYVDDILECYSLVQI